MRLFEYSYQGVRIFSERPYGYKRYIVVHDDGRQTMYSGLWYKLDRIKDIIKEQVDKVE
jgi:hypothetical protein